MCRESSRLDIYVSPCALSLVIRTRQQWHHLLNIAFHPRPVVLIQHSSNTSHVTSLPYDSLWTDCPMNYCFTSSHVQCNPLRSPCPNFSNNTRALQSSTQPRSAICPSPQPTSCAWPATRISGNTSALPTQQRNSDAVALRPRLRPHSTPSSPT